MPGLCNDQLDIILDRAIRKDVKNAGDPAAQEARRCVWVALLEPVLDANYPNWRTIHDYP